MCASGVRPLRLPAEDFSSRSIPVLEVGIYHLHRIHETGRAPLYFSRNDGHRFSPEKGAFAVCYFAESAETCLWERFGDEVLMPGASVARGIWFTRSVSHVRVSHLRVCDLTNADVRAACRVDLTALLHSELAVPQAWAASIQAHPVGFEALKYLSRFNQQPCVALFQKPGVPERCRVVQTHPLVSLPESDAFLASQRVALI